MFYLQLSLLHEDLTSGRISREEYEDTIILLAMYHETLKQDLQNSSNKVAA
jgi:hypothetical protein